MNTYHWHITGFRLEDHPDRPNLVHTVFFTVTAADPTGQHTWSLNSEAYLNIQNQGQFIPYQELTQDIVLEWVKSCFTVEDYAKTMLGLDKALAEHIAQKQHQARIVHQLPWGEGPPVTPQFQFNIPSPQDYGV
jgi:hypothetical protein